MKGQRLALFDFDGTMITGDSINRLVRRMAFDGLMRPLELLQLLILTLGWKLGLYPVTTLKTKALAPLSRLPAERAEAYCKGFVESELLPRLYPDAVATLKRHADLADLVLLVSASPLCYLQHMMSHLPLAGVIASSGPSMYRITENVVREAKVEHIDTWLQEQGVLADFEQSSAYGNSCNDLPMLRLVGKPHLVNASSRMKRKAKGMGSSLIWKEY